LERTFLQFNKLHERIIIVNFIDHGSYITVTMTNNTKTEASKTPHNTVIQTKTQYCILWRVGVETLVRTFLQFYKRRVLINQPTFTSLFLHSSSLYCMIIKTNHQRGLRSQLVQAKTCGCSARGSTYTTHK